MDFVGLLKSKTVIGIIVAVIGALAQPDVLALLPHTVASIVTALGAVLTAVGLRTAIANNGVGSTPAAADKANGAS